MDKQGADTPKSAPKHALSGQDSTFRAIVDTLYVINLKPLRREN